MKRILFIATLVALTISCNSKRSADSQTMTPSEVQQLVKEAYYHSFPIVENYKAMYAYAILETSPRYLPMNKTFNASVLYSPADKFVVSPNNDTYYTTGNLDLRAEPVIIKVPEITDRYYSFQLNSMVTDNFGYIGTNTTGTKAGIYAITSPSFSGKLPEGVIEIKSPSELIGLIGRTAVNADDENDIKKAKEVQAKYQIGVMHEFYPEFSPTKVEAINFPTYEKGDEQTTKFFELLNFLLPYIKLSDDEQPIIDSYQKIGVLPGKAYTFFKDHPEYKDAIEKGIQEGIAQIDSTSRNLGSVKNGWTMFPLGTYFGANYTDRTNIAKIGIYANSPFEAYYPLAFTDSENQVLDGNNNYSITFPSGALPPAKFFWSLTMYDNASQLLVENSLKRYSIGDRTKSLKPNADGSLTIYIGNKQPKEGIGNWLPAPAAEFNVMMRLYGPKENVLSGEWTPPAITKIK